MTGDDLVKRNNKQKSHSLYTIEFGAPVDAIRSNGGDSNNHRDESLSPKPMTPRKVKRRSVRGTSSRQSRRSANGGGAGSSGTHRSSTSRSSRRKVHQNPVTKLIDQQNSFPAFRHSTNSNLTENNLKSLNNVYVDNKNEYHHQRIPKKEQSNLMPSKSQPALNSFQKQINEPQQQLTSNAALTSNINRHTPTDPIYYNMNASSPLIIQQTSWNTTSTPSPQVYSSTNLYHQHHHHPSPIDDTNMGHINPTYQHSTPNLTDVPDVDEYYQVNRPPSVRSSYSNFHGARPLSYNQNPNGRNNQTQQQQNFFAGLNQQQQHQKYSHQSQSQAIPQVPRKGATMSASRESLRFLNGAPPAYAYNHHTPPDSETTM